MGIIIIIIIDTTEHQLVHLEIKQGRSGKLSCSEEHEQAEEEPQKAPERELY